MLEYFGVPVPESMLGKVLKDAVASDAPVRETCIYGVHGGPVACTDGTYTYILPPDKREQLYEYTLMPTHMRAMFSPEELRDMSLSQPFPFTKGCPLMKIPADPFYNRPALEEQTLLFDLKQDPVSYTHLDDRLRPHHQDAASGGKDHFYRALPCQKIGSQRAGFGGRSGFCPDVPRG